MSIKYLTKSPPIIPIEGIEFINIEKAKEFVLSQDSLSLDTETEGIFNLQNKVLLLQLGNFDTQLVIDVRNYKSEELAFIGEFLENPNKEKLLWNAKFDYKFIKYTFGWELANVYDGFLVECLLTNGLKNRQLSLGDNAYNYLGVKLNKAIRSRFSKNEGVPFTTEEIIYAAEDVRYLHKIKELQMIKVKEWGLENVVKLENEVTLAFADIEYNGMDFNKEAWLKLSQKAEDTVKILEKELDQLVLETPKLKKFILPVIQGNLFGGEERMINIKWSSPTQIKLVFQALGIEDIESTSEKEIAKYQIKYPIIKKFIDYKKEQKLVTTYGKDFVKHIWKDGRVRTSFWQILETGRVSSGMKSRKTGEEYPNMQNIPAKNEYRNCFKAKEGFTLVSVDFSG
jgi:DNA polymerase I-like protein with 3'-5' exonuclease and polymerase domains